MLISLLTTVLSNTVCFLYPAYASYKALSLPPSTLESERALERWLMYWAVVGSWTAIEAAIGWCFTWVPFYNIIKSLVFAYLALPQSEGSSYIYRAHLAPFFQEHERDIDLFLASLRGRAGSAFADALTWLWAKVRTQLNIALPHEPPAGDQAQGPLPGQPYPTGNMSAGQPPTFHDQAGGLQKLYGVAARYAASYAPAALGALSQFTDRARTEQQQQHPRSASVTSQTMEMPIPRPTPAQQAAMHPDASLRSRTFAQAQGQADPYPALGLGMASSSPGHYRPMPSQSQRSSSESLQSAQSGNGRWAEMSYEQINKSDVWSGSEGQGNRPDIQGRRSSSGRWFSWGDGKGPDPRQKTE